MTNVSVGKTMGVFSGFFDKTTINVTE